VDIPAFEFEFHFGLNFYILLYYKSFRIFVPMDIPDGKIYKRN